MIEHLKCNIDKFIGAVHLSDVHIRLLKRFDEYAQQFDKFYHIIDKTPEKTVIVVAGDLLHNKVDLSPESVDMAAEFLKNLANKRPTILIPGNHDAVLANRSRLDSLSPIVRSLNHPNLHYLKKSGLFAIGDILFNNMSVLESCESYIHATKIPSIYRNKYNHIIGLYHGPVQGAITDVGYAVVDKVMTTDIFDGHDLVFLGDIHRAQTLQDYDPNTGKPAIVYPGSMMQQDHGEDRKNHGYVIWNLPKRMFYMMEIPNDYGFFTIDVEKGKLITDVSNIPSKVRLRVRCKESGPTEVKNILSTLKKSITILEAVYIRADLEDSGKQSINVSDLNLNEIYSPEYQNKLIENFLNKKYTNKEVTADLLTKICELNKELNNKLNKESTISSRNIRWIPKKFEFDNMFSYGENNVIDFTKLHGLTGLFASNTSGKSSIFSALTFCLFDKCERTFKASYILNSQKMSFTCKFNFEINGVDYFIRRKGTADKKGNVKVDVEFWKVVDDKVIQLNGEARRSTNDIIRDYIGTYDDFILTTLSVQTNNNKTASAFVDMGQTERKDLLSQFMGLTVFDELYQMASDKLKEINAVLKEYSMTDSGSEQIIQDFNSRVLGLESELKQNNELLDKSNLRREEINTIIIEENKKMIKLEKNVPKDVNKLELSRESLKSKIKFSTERLEKSKSDLIDKKLELEQIQLLHDSFIKQNVEDTYKLYKSNVDDIKKLENVIDKKKIVVSNKLEKLKKLEKHEYDPNCKFCMNNIFVKDALETKSALETDKRDVENLLNELSSLNAESKVYGDIQTKYNEFEQTKKQKSKSELSIHSMENEILKLENSIVLDNNSLSDIEESIKLYYQQKDAIEQNISINNNIELLSAELKRLNSSITNINKGMLKLSTELVSVKKDEEEYKQNITKIKEYESMQKAYEFYTLAVSRDGIPFDLISQAVPIVEKEVNEMLRQMTDFTVNIQTDGKNVTTYLIYDNKSWPLEMSSGMEKFISSIAIRVALINISNLPKTTGFVIDEGFGVLDADSMSTIQPLFQYLKNQFEFILIISHIDSMKDIVNNLIEIKKNNGFSSVNFS